jgi:hypothetical protein
MRELPGLTFVYRLADDIWVRLIGRGHNPSPVEIEKLREKWGPLFEKRIQEQKEKQLWPDVIIRDIRCLDHYPSETGGQRVSSWFHAGLVGTYHRGLRISLKMQGLCLDKATSEWRYPDTARNEKPDITTLLCGLIRYENIESVDWDGDERCSFPHIYCHFVEAGRQPYERVVFCEPRRLTRGEYHYLELADLDAVQRRSKKGYQKAWLRNLTSRRTASHEDSLR